MPAFSYYDIPGYKEAVDREASLRMNDFVRDHQILCGLKVKPMTLRHLLLLEAVESPFVSNADVEAVHVPQFLWIVSVDFEPMGSRRLRNLRVRRKRKSVIRRSRRLRALQAISDIQSYVETAFWDAPQGKQRDKAPYASWVAMITHQIGKSYGALPAGGMLQQIMDMPLTIVWQLVRCIHKEADPDALLDNRSSMVVHEYLARQNGEEWP